MKSRGSFIKLALCMLLGAVIGMTGNIIISLSREDMEEAVSKLGEILSQTGVIVECLLTAGFVAAAIGIYLFARSLWRKEQEAEDEAADQCGERFERWVQAGIIITNCATGILLVFGCMVLPDRALISLSTGLPVLVLALVMILGTTAMAVMEILLYRLMQKRDPQKKGDPASFSFNKKWLESCDETEKLVIYQAGYRAYGYIQIALLVGIILAIFGQAQFGTGKFPVLLTGTIWIIGTAGFGICKLKGLKRQ